MQVIWHKEPIIFVDNLKESVCFRSWFQNMLLFNVRFVVQLQICMSNWNFNQRTQFRKSYGSKIKYVPTYANISPLIFSAVLDFDFATSKSGLWSSLDRLTLKGNMKYECAIKKLVKSQSGHTEMITLWSAKGFSVWPLWFDEFFNSVIL